MISGSEGGIFILGNIHFYIPYSLEKNIGKEYNRIMATIPDGDAAVFQDGDICHTVPNFGHIITDYFNTHPDSVLTCWTNRIHELSVGQLHPVMKSVDVVEVLRFAETIKDDRTVTRLDGPVSMLLMVVPKLIWLKHKFTEVNTYRPNETNMLGVDNHFTNGIRRIGIDVLRMNGIIVWHSYRLLTGSKQHLL